jgi:hypothetical protein
VVIDQNFKERKDSLMKGKGGRKNVEMIAYKKDTAFAPSYIYLLISALLLQAKCRISIIICTTIYNDKH